jgi:hypothetical protein
MLEEVEGKSDMSNVVIPSPKIYMISVVIIGHFVKGCQGIVVD